MVLVRWLAAVLAVGCVETGTTSCPNGRTCPAQTVCDTMHDICVDPSQLTACEGLGNGDPCAIRAADDGICDQTVCIVKGCGDGYRRDNEQCDGADVPTDADCTKLGFYDEGTPTCNDACSFDTNIETTVCTGYCGDGTITPGIEVCETGTGITSSCVEEGFGTGRLDCSECRPDTRRCIPFGWQYDAVPAQPFSVHGTAADDVWVLMVGNKLAHFDGMTWSPVDLAPCALPDGELTTLWAPTRGTAIAMSSDTVVVVTATTCTKIMRPSNYPMDRLWASSATDIWVTVSGDGMWRYDGTWDRVLDTIGGTPDAGLIVAVWGSGPTDVWAAINAVNPPYDHLTHYDGTGWTTPIDPGIASPTSIWGTGPNDVYVASQSTGEIRRWNGATWEARTSPLALDAPGYGRIAQGVATSDGRVYVVGAFDNRSFLFASDGDGWTQLGAPPAMTAFFAAADAKLFAASSIFDRVGRFTGTAMVETGDAVRSPAQLVAHAGDDALAISYSGFTLEHWNGAAWQTVTAVPTPRDVKFAPDGTAAAVAYDTGLYVRSSDGSWSNATTGGLFASAVSPLSPTAVWVLGIGAIWLANPSTNDFDKREIPLSFGFDSDDIYAASTTDVWVVGSDVSGILRTAEILHYDGVNWTEETIPTGFDAVRRIRGRSATDIYAIAVEGVLLHSTGAGAWTTVATPAGLIVTDVAGAADDLFITTNDGLWHFDGATWLPVDLGAQPYGAYVAVAGDTIHALDVIGGHFAFGRLTPW